MTDGIIGVIGAGTIGIGVATDAILHGMDAVVVDIEHRQLQRAKDNILQNVRFAPLLSKKAPKVTSEEAESQLLLTTDLEDVSRCTFIVENVPEVWSTKESVYAQLDQICPDDVCFGANTSCTPVTKIGSITNRPERIAGIHFMNPVHLKNTVEVIKGFHTSEDTLTTVRDLLKKWGKNIIVVGDSPGFVSNRISHLFMNEAAFVLQDQLAEAKDIDNLFKQCFGHAMGPLETADLIGLDTVMHSLDVLFEEFHDSKYRCCPLLRKLVYAGHFGRKSGKGFYEYETP